MSPLLRSASILALAAAALAAHADIVVVAPTSTAAGSFTITAPITFNVTAAGNARLFVLQGLVSAADASPTAPAISPALAFRRNGVPVMGGGTDSFTDNLGGTLGAVAPRDGYFRTGGGFTVAANDTVTLDAATYVLEARAGFNPLATQTFTGDAFLSDSSGNRLSPNVSAVGSPVPEPASMAVLGLGALGLLKRRKRA